MSVCLAENTSQTTGRWNSQATTVRNPIKRSASIVISAKAMEAR
jgi:hypothetical protein